MGDAGRRAVPGWWRGPSALSATTWRSAPGSVHYGSDMTANFYGAAVGWGVCFAVTAGSAPSRRGSPTAELVGLVYDGKTGGAAHERARLGRAKWLAAAVAAVLLLLNWLFY